MKTRQLLGLSLVLFSSAVLAQSTIPTVVVRAETAETLDVACDGSAPPSPRDVERVLVIKDPQQTPALRKKLIGVVDEACDAGVPRILVTRAATGKSLSWKAAL